jgi:hypothetical protein
MQERVAADMGVDRSGGVDEGDAGATKRQESNCYRGGLPLRAHTGGTSYLSPTREWD